MMKQLAKILSPETLRHGTKEPPVSYMEEDDSLKGYSLEEIESIIRMKKKYPNAIIPKIDKETGKEIFPAEIAEDWD